MAADNSREHSYEKRMLYEALLVPHEGPPTLREIKRALLTYDKVTLIEPSDRELFPRHQYMQALAPSPVPFPLMDTGPVRPMGKTAGYDDIFQQIIDACAPAKEQGLIDIRSTFKPLPLRKESPDGGVSIGLMFGDGSGGYPLPSNVVFNLFRSFAANQTLLHAAISADANLLIQEIEANPVIVLSGRADAEVYEPKMPPLPLLDSRFAHIKLDELTKIARARLAAFIKYTGYCDAKNLCPILSSRVYGSISDHALSASREVLTLADERVELMRNRVLELCHEEYLKDELLDSLPMKEVLGLRTSAWGQQAEAREALFKSAHAIANEVTDVTRFEEQVRGLIKKYRDQAADVLSQREKLGVKLKCDLVQAALGSGAPVAGLLTQVISVGGMALTLAAVGIWAAGRVKEYLPDVRKWKTEDEKLHSGAGFGLANFYSRIK